LDRERRTSNTTTTMSDAAQTTPCSTAMESVDVVAANDDPLEVQSHCSERSVERRVFVAAATRKVKSYNDLALACVDNDGEQHDRFAVLAAQHHHHQQQWKLSEQNRRRSFSTLRDLLGALDEGDESLRSSFEAIEMCPPHAAITPPRAADT